MPGLMEILLLVVETEKADGQDMVHLRYALTDCWQSILNVWYNASAAQWSQIWSLPGGLV